MPNLTAENWIALLGATGFTTAIPLIVTWVLNRGRVQAEARMQLRQQQLATQQAQIESSIKERQQLTDEQVKFRQDMAAQLAAQQAQIENLYKRNDALEAREIDLGKEIAALQVRNAFLERQSRDQAEVIQALRNQNTQQAEQIAALTEDKVKQNERLQVLTAQKEFLERENGDFRREIARLRDKLPARLEGETT